MRKKVILILIGIMTMAMAAGCSSGNGDNGAVEGTTAPAATETTAAATPSADLISEDKARGIALKRVDGAKDSHIVKFKLDQDDKRQVYEGEIIYNQKEYDFEIDAVSGDVLEWEEDSVKK